MGKTEIKAIFFDLGNVLVRFNADKLEAELTRFGSISRGEFKDYFMESDNMNRYMEGKLNSSQFYSRTRRQFKLNIKFGEFFRLWNEIFYAYPEMEKVILTLREKHPDIKLILVSNTNEAHYEHIRQRFGFLNMLDGHVVSHEVGVQKPATRIFQEALKLSGTLPKETFYTDDRPDLISAARVLGIHAYLFTGHENLSDQLSRYDVFV